MRSRPAETVGTLGAIATGVAALAGGSVELVAVVGVVAGALPAAVTFLVSNGGIRGVARALWRGSR